MKLLTRKELMSIQFRMTADTIADDVSGPLHDYFLPFLSTVFTFNRKPTKENTHKYLNKNVKIKIDKKRLTAERK